MADVGGFNPEFEQRLNRMIAASGGRLSVASGYRSVARQKQLFDAAVKKYGSVAAARHWVAPPGHSQHNEGIAADLKGDLAWAHAHAKEFGLVFPMAHEKWHIALTGIKNGKGATTKPDDYADAPGSPDALNGLTIDDEELKRRGTMEGQLANLMAGITAGPDPQTQEF